MPDRPWTWKETWKANDPSISVILEDAAVRRRLSNGGKRSPIPLYIVPGPGHHRFMEPAGSHPTGASGWDQQRVSVEATGVKRDRPYIGSASVNRLRTALSLRSSWK